VITPAAGRATRVPVLALLAADGISQLGNTLTMLAIPWFVLVTTGSAARTGITAAVGVVPIILAGIFGGALVDRLGYKRTSVVADIASGVNVALVPLLYHTIGLEFWQLLVLVFLGAILDTPGYTARRALYPELAEAAGIPLERTNAYAQIVSRVAGLAGPPLAGVLIALLGASNVLWIDAVSFIVSAAAVALAVSVPKHAPAHTMESAPSNYRSEILDGLRFIRNEPVVLWLTIVSALGGLLAEPVYSVILPVYAKEVFGSAVGLGLALAALAAGSLVGNAIFLALGPRLPRRGTIVLGYAVRALTFWVLIPLPPLAIVAGSIVVNASFLEPANPIVMTVFQERVPAGMRGRVFGALMAIGATTRPIGYLMYGLLIEQIGLRDTLVVLAVVNLLVPLAAWLAPSWRDMERPVEAKATG
jgi:MFS family permease